VFDAKRRPWILPGATSAEQAAEVIAHCPSGALHFEDKAGVVVEPVPVTNTVVVWHNGPLQVTGNLRIEGTSVQIEQETRATLCRCGASQNKPFCDNAHKNIGFEGTTIEPMTVVPLSEGGPLKITVVPNGPLNIQGAFTLYNAQNEVLATSRGATLCRCGGSSKKPFCDGTHLTNGFSGE
jgi:CDGSH-type Zn-finger protein